MLFRPFDLGKWFVIGFCAWLAYLGSGGGRAPHGNFSFGDGRRGLEAQEVLHEAREFVLENVYWIIPVAVLAVLVGVVLWLVITWLNSRGRFMFLHCVVHNKAEVKIPWTRFREHANSLFLFRIVLGLIGFVAIALPVVLSLILVVAIVSAGVPAAGPIIGIVFLVLWIIAISICLGLIGMFTMHFVVPIMFLRTTSIRVAWRAFLTILSVNKARLLLYLLFQFVIGLTIGMIILAGVCITCCCLACILGIPYIGTVIMLPVLVFKRSYSLYYLRQFGPQFDVFSTELVEAQPA